MTPVEYEPGPLRGPQPRAATRIGAAENLGRSNPQPATRNPQPAPCPDADHDRAAAIGLDFQAVAGGTRALLPWRHRGQRWRDPSVAPVRDQLRPHGSGLPYLPRLRRQRDDSLAACAPTLASESHSTCNGSRTAHDATSHAVLDAEPHGRASTAITSGPHGSRRERSMATAARAARVRSHCRATARPSLSPTPNCTPRSMCVRSSSSASTHSPSTSEAGARCRGSANATRAIGGPRRWPRA